MKRIIPQQDLGVRDLVNYEGQMFFVYDFVFEGIRRQMLIPQTVRFEMEAIEKRKNAAAP